MASSAKGILALVMEYCDQDDDRAWMFLTTPSPAFGMWIPLRLMECGKFDKLRTVLESLMIAKHYANAPPVVSSTLSY